MEPIATLDMENYDVKKHLIDEIISADISYREILPQLEARSIKELINTLVGVMEDSSSNASDYASEAGREEGYADGYETGYSEGINHGREDIG